MIGRRRDTVIALHRAFRERQRARLVAVGMRLSGVVRERRSTLGVTSDALIEFVLRCELGVEAARPGISGRFHSGGPRAGAILAVSCTSNPGGLRRLVVAT